ncbi:MAG: recombination mediator RecR [Pseudomonadota bacterium]
MADSSIGPELERVIQLLARLPGLGPRSARRAALHLLKRKDQLMQPLAEALAVAHERVSECPTCGNVDTVSPCAICADPRRDDSLIVVVESVGDLWALERARATRGRYHVLGGVLSPLDGIGPEDLAIGTLVSRAQQPATKEIILAISATVEGQTTAYYLTDLLEPCEVSVTRLAHGVPVGGELDYMDEGTLTAAIKARTRLEAQD